MFKNIVGTLGTRIICTVLTLIIVIINSNSFGSEGVGVIGLFVLNITILQIITSFVGGPSLIYLLPRCDKFQLIFLSYLFGILTNGLGTFILYLSGFVSAEYVWHLYLCAFFLALFSVNSLYLLSQENIRLYNIFILLQVTIHLLILLILLFVCNRIHVSAYMYSYGVSYILSFGGSVYYVVKDIRYRGFDKLFHLFGQMFKYGFLIQIANLSQLLNYRMSYYVIKFIAGVKPLGLFDLGTKLSEAIWIFPRSISTVQYTRISNCGDDKVYAKKITLSFLKLTFVFAVIAVILLFCIPAQWLGLIFGNEFIASKKIIYALGGGIIVLSCNIILSHYFSGFGNYKINTIASAIGLAITGGLSLVLIFFFDRLSCLDRIFTMGLITSLSYLSSFVYTMIGFVRDADLKLKELQIKQQDISLVKTELKKRIEKLSKKQM
jgi:O-antigen/teichoic acid export membrane protein